MNVPNVPISVPGRRRPRIARLGALAALGLLLSTAHGRAESLTDLVRRADRVLRGKTSAAVLEMEVRTKSLQRTYEMVIWDDSSGGKSRTLVKILGPTSWRGYATLKIDNQLKFYDPKTNHVQAVGSSMLGDSWMGSHFSNDDLVKETQLAVHYTATLTRSYEGKTELGDLARFSEVRLLPRPTAPVAWGRIDFDLWERGDAVVPVQSAYFTRASDEHPARTMKFSGLKEIQGRIVPTRIEVTVASKPGESTRLTYEKIRFDVDVPSSKFTEQALR